MNNEVINCSGAIFIDKSLRILLEDRRKFSKNGEEWGFFGGHAENGETSEQTLKREILEELNYDIKEYKLFKVYNFIFNGIKRSHHMYISPIPDMNNVKVHDGANGVIFPIEEALKLKTTDTDKQILLEVFELINKSQI